MRLKRVRSTIGNYLCQNESNRIFWVDAYDAKHPKKKRLTVSTGETTRAAAEDVAKRLWRAWQDDTETEEAKTKRLHLESEAKAEERRRGITFGEVASEVVAQYQASSRDIDTKKKIEGVSRLHLAPFFGSFRIRDITPALVESFYVHFRQTHPGETLEDKVKYLNAIMGHAFAERYVDRMLRFKNPDPHKETGRALTEEEQARLLEASRANETDWLRVELALRHAMRPEEAGGLRYDWIGSDGVIRIPGAKTKRRLEDKQIPLHPTTFGVLMARKERAGSPYVFPSRGNPEKPMLKYRKAWQALKRRAGVDETPRAHGGPGPLRYDDLRHTWLTQAAKNLKQQHEKTIRVLQSAIEGIRQAENKEAVLQILTEALLTLNATKVDYGVAEICAFAQHSITVFQKKYLHLKPGELKALNALIPIAVKLRERG